MWHARVEVEGGSGPEKFPFGDLTCKTAKGIVTIKGMNVIYVYVKVKLNRHYRRIVRLMNGGQSRAEEPFRSSKARTTRQSSRVGWWDVVLVYDWYLKKVHFGGNNHHIIGAYFHPVGCRENLIKISA